MTYKTLHRTLESKKHEPHKTICELMCSGRVSNPCSTSGTRGVTLVKNPLINHDRGKDVTIAYGVGSVSCHCEVCSIQPYVMKFVKNYSCFLHQ